MTTKECEFDPDHLYHDHREADELRAEVAGLQAEINAAGMGNPRDRQISELRAELERLRNVEIVALEQEADAHLAEIERLRAALEKIAGMRLGHSSWHVKVAQDALANESPQ